MSNMPIMTVQAMSARRAPLSANPNAANSPLRGSASRTKRSYANLQREEPYGHPPPLKKQMLEIGSHRAVRDPNAAPTSASTSRARPAAQVHRARPKPAAPSAEVSKHQSAQEKELLMNWQKQYKARFPRMVFYFDSVSDDVRARLVKHIVYLGACEEKFFSNNVTHVITSRPVPQPESADSSQGTAHVAKHGPAEEQPQTINPSLLDCSTESRRKILHDLGNRRSHAQEELARVKPARNNDVLHKARDMGKRIYSVEKLQRILDSLLEKDPYASRSASTREQSHETNLAKLLRKERLNGPSDRDPRAVTRELTYFRGPYIYVYDMDEKTKPILVREYPKVADKADGEWPQFKTVSQGRCPFVDESNEARLMKRAMEKRAAKEAAASKAAAAATDRESAQRPADPAAARVIGKRSRDDYGDPLAEARDAQNRTGLHPRATDVFNPNRTFHPRNLDFTSQKFFTGRTGTGRVLAGEPVASGVQPSNITSAIRSQMVSSNAGVPGAKAGTSKEVQNLQKSVLQKTTPILHNNGIGTTRRLVTTQSLDGQSSRALGVDKASRALQTVTEDDVRGRKPEAAVNGAAPPAQKSKKDMKPGYCENCMDKFEDFDDHIVSRKHRKFAECLDNWAELDDLLAQLERPTKYSHLASDNDDEQQHAHHGW